MALNPLARVASRCVFVGVARVVACGPDTPDVSRGPTCAADAARANLDFTLRDLDGQDVRLSHLEGKVVFLNFWATWCGPCRCRGTLPGRPRPAGIASD